MYTNSSRSYLKWQAVHLGGQTVHLSGQAVHLARNTQRNLTSKGGGPLAADVVDAEEGNDRFMIHGKNILSYGWRF